jgi:hypothetical protein
MKKILLPLLVAGLASGPVSAALVYEDSFDDGDPAANGYAGNFIQDNAGNPMTEADGMVQWGAEGGWSWGGSNIQSLDEFSFPKADEKYAIEWTIGPMEVTTTGESWGDIRMQFILMPKNADRGTPASTEFWSMTEGGLGIDIVYKNGSNLFANFVAKNDTSPANSNPVGVAGQTGHQIDPSQENTFVIELTSTEASLYVNGSLSQTVPLFQWDLGGGVGEEYENGFYLSSRGARANAGRGTMSVSRVSVDLSSAAPPPAAPVPTLAIQPATPGLRLFSSNGQYDRQTVRTTVPEYSWVGSATPVTYSVTISEYPAEAGYQTVMYLVPGEGFGVDRNYPDWSEKVCAVAFINNTAEGGGNMRFAYKNHLPESNGLAGHDYWTTDNGGTYTGMEDPPLGAAGTGQGGTIAYVNSATILGTWSATFTSNTTVEITAPDGQTATGTLLPETAALFAGPMYVYFGTVPQSLANIGLGATFSNIAISGVANPIQESFSSPLDPALLEESASNPSAVIQIIPSDTPFWLRWTVPDSGYKLQQSATLTAVPAWQDAPAAETLLLRGEKWRLLPASGLPNAKAGYFRLLKP